MKELFSNKWMMDKTWKRKRMLLTLTILMNLPLKGSKEFKLKEKKRNS
jgi:hypothetical protein